MEQKGNVKNSNDYKVINVVHLIFFCILLKDLNIVGSFRYCYHFSICIVRSHLFVACMVAALLAVAAVVVALIIGLVVLALVGCIRVDKKAPLFLQLLGEQLQNQLRKPYLQLMCFRFLKTFQVIQSLLVVGLAQVQKQQMNFYQHYQSLSFLIRIHRILLLNLIFLAFSLNLIINQKRHYQILIRVQKFLVSENRLHFKMILIN